METIVVRALSSSFSLLVAYMAFSLCGLNYLGSAAVDVLHGLLVIAVIVTPVSTISINLPPPADPLPPPPSSITGDAPPSPLL